MNAKTADAWWPPLFAAWLIALTATAAALFIGEVMGQTPCVLCWHQRVAMFPLALVLGVACLVGDKAVWRYAMPIAGVGAAIALWHNVVYFKIVPEALEPCSQGVSCTSADMTILGGVPLPLLSLLAFLGILALLAQTKRKAGA